MSYHTPYDPLTTTAPLSPRYGSRGPPSPGGQVPPDLDNMPLPDPTPLSPNLPPGARQPQQFYGMAISDDNYTPRPSFNSAEYGPSSLYGPHGDYQGSQYSSVSRLPIGMASESTSTLVPPGQLYQQYRDDPYQSDGALPLAPMGESRMMPDDYQEKRDLYAGPRQKKQKAGKWTLIISAVVLLVAIAVVVPLYFFVFKKKSSDDDSTSTSTSNTTSPQTPIQDIVTSGGNGSTVTTENGTFTYINNFGGFWVWDPNNPFNNSAQAQSWTPPLSQPWNWGVDMIRGVNLGGWLNTEPFISPSLYEKYQNDTPIQAVDEYTLCQNMINDTESGGLGQLTTHYATFITEEDFAQIAAAGLNFVRIPIGYWALEVYAGEPFLEGVSWQYLLKAISWARKYGIRINLDLHAVPGSQNGFNHSGKLGTVGFLNGVMGIANAQRTLNYIRILTEFVTQPEYSDVIVMFSIVNEVLVTTIGQDNIGQFYLDCHDMIRNITGRGAGDGPFIVIGEGFLGLSEWAGWFTGADRIAIDIHPYLCFGTQDPASLDQQVLRPCSAWGPNQNISMSAFGMTLAGEWSLGFNDCAYWLNGVGLGYRWDGTFPGFSGQAVGSCEPWLDYQSWNESTKTGLQEYALSTMDALQDWFFWTWKIGNSTVYDSIQSPLWSYQLGLQEGFMPPDPRAAEGICNSQGVTQIWTPPLSAWQTGGAGAGTISASWYSSLGYFPPTSLPSIADVVDLPTYTQTGTIFTLPVPTFTPTNASVTINAGNGWFDTSDQVPLYTPVSGCTYLGEYDGVGAPVPTAPCTGPARKRFEPAPTAPPKWR